MDCGRWNEWDGLWTEGNKNETWSMKCGLKEMRWNMNNEVDNATGRRVYLFFPGGHSKVYTPGTIANSQTQCAN